MFSSLHYGKTRRCTNFYINLDRNLQELNFNNIKINAVLLKGINDSEKDFNDWAEFVKNNEIDFRCR